MVKNIKNPFKAQKQVYDKCAPPPSVYGGLSHFVHNLQFPTDFVELEGCHQPLKISGPPLRSIFFVKNNGLLVSLKRSAGQIPKLFFLWHVCGLRNHQKNYIKLVHLALRPFLGQYFDDFSGNRYARAKV